jgi:hypothetical protein
LPASPTPPHGAERPRVEVAPPAADSLGGLACDFASAAGLRLEPWQESGLEAMLSVREDGHWACFEYGELCSRQNGKTLLAMVRALAGLFLFDEHTILWSAHEYRTAMRSFKDMRALLDQIGTPAGPNLVDVDGIPVKVNNTNGEESFLRLDTRQEIKLVARSKGAGRGFSTDCMIIDEAFAYDERQQDALMPTLTARPNPQIIYLSSPPLTGDTGGPLYALRRRAERARIADDTLGWRDWGLPGDLDDLLAMPVSQREAFLDDQERWAATNPGLGLGRVTIESIARNRRAMSEAGFAREVLGLWPRELAGAGAWQVLSESAWKARGGAIGRPETGLAFALDASWPDAGMGSIAIAGARGGELLVQVVEHRQGTSWMVARTLELRERWPDAVFVLDKRGPVGHLLRELEEEKVPLVLPQAVDIAAAFGRVVAGVKGDQPNLRHYDQPDLDAAVQAAGTRPLGDGRIWARQHDDGADIGPLTAVTLAAGEAARRAKPPPPSPIVIEDGTATHDELDVALIGF